MREEEVERWGRKKENDEGGRKLVQDQFSFRVCKSVHHYTFK